MQTQTLWSETEKGYVLYVWPEGLGNRGGPVLACQSLAMQKRDGSGCQAKGNMGDGTQEPKNS